jgi:hypothetical protein
MTSNGQKPLPHRRADTVSVAILTSSACALPKYLGALRGGGAGADNGLT